VTPQRITAATYNVHEWIGRNGRQEPARAIRILNDINADVVALQEVSFPCLRAHPFSIQELSAGTGMEAIPGITFTKKEADFGNVLLTRHPVIRLRKLDLTLKPREPRGAIMATLDIHGTPCEVIGTHLGLRRAERVHQIKAILKGIQTCDKGTHVILMGDLNEWNPSSAALRVLQGSFGRHPVPPTYPARFPILSLDRILVRPRCALQDIRVIKHPRARLASDHLPVTAHIRLDL
jgi:endonuclease/exonuclease/phosphatase family metal-dependent hydrolase